MAGRSEVSVSFKKWPKLMAARTVMTVCGARSRTDWLGDAVAVVTVNTRTGLRESIVTRIREASGEA